MPGENISVLVAHDAAVPGDWAAEHVQDEMGMTVVDVLPALSLGSEKLQTTRADALVVACNDGSDTALQLAEWWVEHHPGRPVVMLCQNSPNGFVQRAFGVGVDDLVVLEPGSQVSSESMRDVTFAVQKAIARKARPRDRELSYATTICFLGPKGGVGKTVACGNVAVSLAARRKRVVLVDLDLQFGDTALSLGLRPERTLYELAVSGGSLDTEKIEAYLTVHDSGLHVLAAPVRPDQAGSVTAEFSAAVVETLQVSYDYVVIDTPPSLTPEVIAAVDASTYVCVVGMLDSLSLKNTRLGLETLELMGYPRDRVRVLLNRANSSVGITGQDVIGILGRPPDILVPSDRAITRAANEGRPIVLSQKRSDAARAFNGLADLFAQVGHPRTARRRTRRFLSRSRG